MQTLKLSDSRERPAADPVAAEMIAECEVNGKRLAVSERGGDPSTRALMRYSVKRERFSRTARLSDIADALDAGLIG